MTADNATAQGAPAGGVPARESFDSFFTRTCPKLLARAQIFCGHRQDAEDAVQTTYIAAFKAWDRINDEYESPEAWLFTVLRNELCTQARKRSKERKVVESIPVPHDPTPEQTADAMAVIDALAALPPKQRSSLVLHRLFGLPQDEVAKRLGIRRSTVAVNVRNARQTLEQLLELSPTPTPTESARDALVAHGRLPHDWAVTHRDPLDERLRAAERWLREAFEDSPEATGRVRAALIAELGDEVFTEPRDTPPTSPSTSASASSTGNASTNSPPPSPPRKPAWLDDWPGETSR